MEKLVDVVMVLGGSMHLVDEKKILSEVQQLFPIQYL